MNQSIEPEFEPSSETDSHSGRAVTVAGSDPIRPFRLSLREFLGLVTIAGLLVGLVLTSVRLANVEGELSRLRRQVGYLESSEPGQIAAVRIPTDRPLSYGLRIRVPDELPFRVVYSTILPRGAAAPDWYGGVGVAPGESMVAVRIAEDPRDGRWKITTLVDSDQGTKRISTVLPEDHVRAFRGTHDVVSTGVGRQTQMVSAERPLRLLDERWLVGEGSLLLYGDRPPERDQVGIYVELQPDQGPL